MSIRNMFNRLIYGIPVDYAEAGAITKHPTPTPGFMPATALSADETEELNMFGSVLRSDGAVWRLWRRDSSGVAWLRRVGGGRD